MSILVPHHNFWTGCLHNIETRDLKVNTNDRKHLFQHNKYTKKEGDFPLAIDTLHYSL